MSKSSSHYHTTVLLHEAVDALDLKNKADTIVIDGTLGGGGHTELLAQTIPNGKVISFDKDINAINYAKKRLAEYKNIEYINDDYVNMDVVVKTNSRLSQPVDGILLDLGVSSEQLDNPERGFSFMRSGPLDMRMDVSKGMTARDIIEQYDEKRLADTLYNYGEERKSRVIARRIKEAIKEGYVFDTTLKLAEFIAGIIREKHKHPATRSFLALRIAVNHELEYLEIAMDKAIELLKPGGRLAIITFHSIEDRIVKQTMAKWANPCECPPRLPCTCGLKPIGKSLKKRAPSEEEVKNNIRSRSAILRVFEKF